MLVGLAISRIKTAEEADVGAETDGSPLICCRVNFLYGDWRDPLRHHWRATFGLWRDFTDGLNINIMSKRSIEIDFGVLATVEIRSRRFQGGAAVHGQVDLPQGAC